MTEDLIYGTYLKAPVNVTWEITHKCNLRCRHCLSGDLRSSGRDDLSLAQSLALVDELARLEVFQINFGGGEPFLRDDFLDLLRYAHSCGITTCVSTNGTVLTAPVVEKLADMELLHLQISLDGATPATNDAIRGEGTFERIVAGIGLLSRFALADWSINMVATSKNLHEVGLMHDLAARYGARTRLSRFRPSGHAAQVWESLRLNKAQMAELAAFLRERPDIRTGDSFFAIEAADRRSLGLKMCGAARMTCSIAPDGSVYPCAFLSTEQFKAGNVVEEPLESIFRDSPIFEKLRTRNVASCGTCARFDYCHGGCPAVAYFVTSSWRQADPECLPVLAEH